MLFAYSGAFIYSFDYTLVDRVAYDKLDRVRLARDSLVNPRRFLARHVRKNLCAQAEFV